MLPTTFRFIWSSCLRVEDFQKSTNQKQELPVVAMFVNGSGQNEQSLQRTFHRFYLPSVGSFGKAVLENKMFRTRPIRNQNCLWQPYLLMDRDEMSNLYRGPPHRCILPSFGSFGKAVSGEKIFKNQQYLYRDNCILNTDIYIQTRVIFLSAEEKIFQKSTNQKQELPVVTMFANRSGQNQQS